MSSRSADPRIAVSERDVTVRSHRTDCAVNPVPDEGGVGSGGSTRPKIERDAPAVAIWPYRGLTTPRRRPGPRAAQTSRMARWRGMPWWMSEYCPQSGSVRASIGPDAPPLPSTARYQYPKFRGHRIRQGAPSATGCQQGPMRCLMGKCRCLVAPSWNGENCAGSSSDPSAVGDAGVGGEPGCHCARYRRASAGPVLPRAQVAAPPQRTHPFD
jgi:hypothetical protein